MSAPHTASGTELRAAMAERAEMRARADEEQRKSALRLMADGLSDSAISKRLHIHTRKVAAWRAAR